MPEEGKLRGLAFTITGEEETPSDVILLRHERLGVELYLPKNIEPERLESLIKTLSKIKPSRERIRNISISTF